MAVRLEPLVLLVGAGLTESVVIVVPRAVSNDRTFNSVDVGTLQWQFLPWINGIIGALAETFLAVRAASVRSLSLFLLLGSCRLADSSFPDSSLRVERRGTSSTAGWARSSRSSSLARP